MYSRLYKHLAAIALLPLVAGCVQATRHSNTMIFGTNTMVGLKVGTSADQVPAIQLGYDRQEMVVMPLVANTREHRDGAVNRLSPCDIEEAVVSASGGTRTPIHPCLLVGINGDSIDSYSVLASFGASFSAEGSASGGLAQYFATGVAAQMLALTGGASVVAVSQAAENSALTPVSPSAINRLYGSQAAYDRGIVQNTAYDRFRTQLIARISETDTGLVETIQAFENRIGTTFGLHQDCPDKNTCVNAVRADDPYRDEFRDNRAAVQAALDEWGQTSSN